LFYKGNIMTITLNGTTGITTPAITNNGTYTGDGVVFADATPANTLVTTTSGNVGVGTSSPSNKLHVAGSTRISGVSSGSAALLIPSGDITFDTASAASAIGNYGDSSSEMRISTRGFTTFRTGATDGTNGSERARITSSGDVLVAKTSPDNNTIGVQIEALGAVGACRSGEISFIANRKTSDGSTFSFRREGTQVGSISVTGSSTAYNTSSDYRLKENIAPMTGALAVVGQLKPCTYTWKADGSSGQGFIAHELAEVVPEAVLGEKDAVDAKGNPEYQGIDTSFLVATLTCAIQELKAELDTVKTELATLKGTV
jgi:hypothetical protein